jgi:uroporphyrinogen-III decarboxylase
MLNVLQGRPVDKIPYVPRLDLWYNANKYSGTLPARYRNAALADIVDDLDFGYHTVVPNFKDIRHQDDELHRALGIYNLWPMPYKTRLENIEWSLRQSGDQTAVEYKTPKGEVSTKVVYDESMKRAGITISHIMEHAIKSHKDYAAVSSIFDNAVVEPHFKGCEALAECVGPRSFISAFISLAGSPMHLLLRELMPFDLFSYELYDHPEELSECARSIGNYFNRIFEIILKCPAEVIFFGANYDATLTYPPFFKEHIVPWLNQLAGALHKSGKYLLTHTDGENSGLLDYYLESGIDIADSICPRPMTKLSFKKVKDHFNGKITIMGGIPSVCLLKDAMPDRVFEKYLEDFFTEIGKGDHLILGISDTTPPAADFERITRIGKCIEEFGPVNP